MVLGGGFVSPAPKYDDLVSGNDRDFTSSTGAWVASGGTLSRDTSWKIVNTTASLKHVTTAISQYVELPIAGTFRAGVDYWAVVWLSFEETSGSADWAAAFGLQGTETSTGRFYGTLSASELWSGATNRFVACMIHWRPATTRTGVRLRLTRSSATVEGTKTLHVGNCRVIRSAEVPSILHPSLGSRYVIPMMPINESGGVVFNGIAAGVAPGNIANIEFASNLTRIMTPDGVAGFEATSNTGNQAFVYIYGEHTLGDLVEQGIAVEAGEDYLGWFYSQKAGADTVDGRAIDGTGQFYSDFGDYDHEFVDGYDGTVGAHGGNGRWRHRASGDVFRDFAQMEARKGQGTAQIDSGTTSEVVAHGAGYTPAAQDIHVTPTNNPTNDPGWWWISAIDGTNFTINVRSDPGASHATFSWRVDR